MIGPLGKDLSVSRKGSYACTTTDATDPVAVCSVRSKSEGTYCGGSPIKDG